MLFPCAFCQCGAEATMKGKRRRTKTLTLLHDDVIVIPAWYANACRDAGTRPSSASGKSGAGLTAMATLPPSHNCMDPERHERRDAEHLASCSPKASDHPQVSSSDTIQKHKHLQTATQDRPSREKAHTDQRWTNIPRDRMQTRGLWKKHVNGKLSQLDSCDFNEHKSGVETRRVSVNQTVLRRRQIEIYYLSHRKRIMSRSN